jgi:putative NADH-flavin reductase
MRYLCAVRAIVFGASGGTGRAVIDAATATGDEVTAFVRDASRLDGAKARIVTGSVLEAAQLEAAIAGHDVVISAFTDKAVMEELLAAGDLEWTCVRPGMLTNGAARGTWRVADGGELVGGKIARADVAAFMLVEAAKREWLRKRPTIVW